MVFSVELVAWRIIKELKQTVRTPRGSSHLNQILELNTWK